MEIYFLLAISIGTAAAVFVVIGSPLFRNKDISRAGDRLELLNASLEGIERDHISGFIGDEDSGEAIIVAKRESVASDASGGAFGVSKSLRFSAVFCLALTPVAAAFLYFKVGTPELIVSKTQPQNPALDPGEVANLPEDDRRTIIKEMVARLAARLEKTPEDVEGWRMLARSEFVLGDLTGSAASYRRLFALEPGTIDDWRNFSAALISAVPEGRFPTDQEFIRALDEIEKRNPGDQMVLFYRGGAAREAGDSLRAIELWMRLLEAMPADAPARAALEQLIEEASIESVSK